MRASRQTELANLLQEHLARLHAVIDDLAERGEPVSEMEARLLLEAASARVREIEHALRQDASRPIRALRHGARAGERVQSWTRPRIGRLVHYPPRPIRLPAPYFRERAPDPPPVISIVTPSFQQGRFLDKTIYSIVTQQYPALEYHVQDGGSTDQTLAVIARFEPSLTSWASEPDAGQADAINRGFRQTRGEIMAWLNSDDLLLPGSLAYVARYFAEHPDVDAVYGHRIMIDETDGQIGAWVLPRHDDRVLTLADYVPQETLFWRRRLWDAVGGGVDPSYTYAVDWELLLRFRAAKARIVRLPRFLGAFRVHEAQKTTANDVVGLAEMAMLRESIHGRHVPVDEVLRALRPYFARHILHHSWQRFVDRLPLARVTFQASPDDDWTVSTGGAKRANPDAASAVLGAAAPE